MRSGRPAETLTAARGVDEQPRRAVSTCPIASGSLVGLAVGWNGTNLIAMADRYQVSLAMVGLFSAAYSSRNRLYSSQPGRESTRPRTAC
jgi:hypothetical protein